MSDIIYERDYTKPWLNLFFVVMFAGVFATLIMWVIPVAIDRSERRDCERYQKYASQYPDFYITIQEQQECDSVGMFVNAPVHRNHY